MAEEPPGRILLVEGADDRHVVHHLCKRLKMPAFSIRDTTGFPALKQAIRPEIKVSGRVALGILADANDDPDQRWNDIADQVRKEGFEPPPQMTPAGAVFGTRPRVGIWLMPDNVSRGELEDFIAQLIPEGDPVWPRAQKYIEDISTERKFAKKILRAQVHAWLATRCKPGRMGAAIQAGDLDVTVPLAMRFANWLRRLFPDDVQGRANRPSVRRIH